jgi:hypothetical protein
VTVTLFEGGLTFPAASKVAASGHRSDRSPLLIETPTMEVIEAAKSDADPAGLASKRAAYDAARLSPHPFILTIVGLGGLAVILWLMVFKPF